MSVPEGAQHPAVGRLVARAPGGEPIAPTSHISIEVVSWVTKFTGGDGTGRRVFEEPLAAETTVRSVLTALSRRFPELHTALWHGDEIGEHIEVLVNDAVLGIRHTLDSRLDPGDQITLLGQYMGG
jgi:molybdopterin converting factor small subunit